MKSEPRFETADFRSSIVKMLANTAALRARMKQKAPNPFMLRLFRENEHCVLILGDIATKLQQVDVSGNVRLRRVRVLLLTLG